MRRPQQPLSAYDLGRQRVEHNIRQQIEKGKSPDRVARVIVGAPLAKSPKGRYRVGGKPAQGHWARRLLPASVFEWLMRREFELQAKPGGSPQ